MKTILVTGASGDIGSAIAVKFGQNGYNVAVNYHRDSAGAMRTVKEIEQTGGRAEAFCCDVSDYDAVSKMFSEIAEAFGAVDVLVNNSGVSSFSLFQDISPELWQRTMAVNLNGCFNCSKAAVPDMIRQKHGKIINISSMWGQVGASCEVHYSTSKAAVIGFTKALAKELGPSGINVNCIAPGVIDTKMNAELGKDALADLREETPLCRLGTPEDIANAVFFLADDASSFITGQIIGVNGGFII